MTKIEYHIAVLKIKLSGMIWLALSLLPLLTVAQGIERYYESKGAERVFAMLPGADDGFILAGNSQAVAGGPTDMLFMRIDAGGNLLTHKTIGQPDLFESAAVLFPTTDGGFVLGGDQGTEATGFNHPMLLKTDVGGTVEWTFVSDLDSVWVSAGSIATDGGWILGGLHLMPGTAERAVFLSKINENGTETWQQTLLLPQPVDGLFGIAALTDGNYLATGVIRESAGADRDVFLLKFNSAGQILDTVILNKPGIQWVNACRTDAQGNVLLAGYETTNNINTDAWLAQTDSKGNLLHNWTIDLGERENIRTVAPGSDGSFLLAGETTPGANQPRNGLLIKLDALGNLLFSKQFGGVKGDFFSAITNLSKGEIAIAGQTASFGNGTVNAYWLRTDALGQAFTSRVNGHIKIDQNTDCFPDSSETPVAGWLVRASGQAGLRYALCDSTGFFNMELDTGIWYISLLPPAAYWSPCADSVEVQLNTNAPNSTLNMAVQAGITCPLMDVALSTPYLRRCFSNNYSVRYFNYGTAPADNAYVDIVLDPYLQLQSTTQPWLLIGADTLRFLLGTVSALQGGSFSFAAFLDCDNTVTGQTHCSAAHIYPDSLCTQFSAQWDQSKLALEGYCAGDSVVLRVRNTGIGNMDAPAEFLITEDLIIIKNDLLRLNAGEDTVFVLYPNGRTVTMRVHQTEGNPYSIAPMLVIEGCAGTVQQFGIPGMYPTDDTARAEDTDCKQSIASFDPNDKTAMPTGVGSQHRIAPNTDLEYQIRFQNTGTDTAFRVEIRDTLATFLDPESVVLGASSHPVRLFQSSGGALHFIFESIHLPDSATNPIESQGFIHFRVSQRRDLPSGTRIENRAGIYFDFNPPVITNVVWHIVGDPKQDMTTGVKSEDAAPVCIQRLWITPNPLENQALIQWTFPNAKPPEWIKLELTDLSGRMLWRHITTQGQVLFDGSNLPAGMYLLSLSGPQTNSVSTKFVKH
jgi:hypothetical protein